MDVDEGVRRGSDAGVIHICRRKIRGARPRIGLHLHLTEKPQFVGAGETWLCWSAHVYSRRVVSMPAQPGVL